MLVAALALIIGQAVNLALIVRAQLSAEQRIEAIAAASAASAASPIIAIETAGAAGRRHRML